MRTEVQIKVSFWSSFFLEEKQQENLSVCIDTCHVFSAGYSLKSKFDAEQFIATIDTYIGWKNVSVIHLNDSKKDCGCHVDRHENLCKGCIGKDDETGLQFFVKYCFNKNIPLILETPEEDHANDLEKVHYWINS